MKYSPNRIPAQPGDIIRPNWPACFAELQSIDVIKRQTGDNMYTIRFKKICSSTFKFYKRTLIKTKTVYTLPYKVEKSVFMDLFDRIHQLTSMIK